MSGDLPPSSRQHWLLERLGEIIEARGPERFLESPLREPSPEHFPDLWTPDEEGVRVMLRRLLQYAGLGMHAIDLEMTGTVNPVALIQESGGGALHTAAWFAGANGRTFRFGCDLAHVHEPQQLAGILSHEVAHAYRYHHGLATQSSAKEESLTDLTTVFLGFGLLTTNIAGMDMGTLTARRSVGTRDKGYLSALEMAFLLAAQAVVRGVNRRVIAEKLRSSPRRYFLAACKHLDQRRAALYEQLHLPIASASASRLFNAGKTVRPVRSRPTRAVLGGVGMLGATAWGASRVLSPAAVGGVIAAGALSLGLAWWLYPSYRCSDPDCRGPLRRGDLICGSCGGQVSGALDQLRG